MAARRFTKNESPHISRATKQNSFTVRLWELEAQCFSFPWAHSRNFSLTETIACSSICTMCKDLQQALNKSLDEFHDPEEDRRRAEEHRKSREGCSQGLRDFLNLSVSRWAPFVAHMLRVFHLVRNPVHVFLNRVQQTVSGNTPPWCSPDTISWTLLRCSLRG